MSITQEGYLYLPCKLLNFVQTGIEDISGKDGRVNGTYLIHGNIVFDKTNRICPLCGHPAHINNHATITLKHIPFGSMKTRINLTRNQYFCPACHHTFEDEVPFKAKDHYITRQLEIYIQDLLSKKRLTVHCISTMTGVHESIIRSIDKKRLEELYTEEDEHGKRRFKMPSHPVRYLGIDEFSLHRPFKFATHITDLETGEVLYVAKGKKKQVVYDFIETAGDEFMRNVEAIACDMNSDFREAFLEKYPHLAIVYDHFHIVKNFNDNVVNKVRQDTYYELCNKHQWEDAAILRKSRYLLLSNRSNLSDEHITKLDQILSKNKLLLATDIIKEKIKYAFTLTVTLEMEETINDIIELCQETGSTHFEWFAKLLKNHLDGIITHAEYPISNGRIEGINNRIKTLRRTSYGFRDDYYFFLKIIDASHKEM